MGGGAFYNGGEGIGIGRLSIIGEGWISISSTNPSTVTCKTSKHVHCYQHS